MHMDLITILDPARKLPHDDPGIVREGHGNVVLPGGPDGNDRPTSPRSPDAIVPFPLRILSVEKGRNDRNLRSRHVIRKKVVVGRK